MAALRSLDIEVDGCEQWVDRLEARGVTSRWAREALWYWQVRLRQARHKQSLAATESPVSGEVSEGFAEGGAAFAQRRRGTGWSHVAEAPEADTDSGLITGGRTVVGDPSLTSHAATQPPVRRVTISAAQRSQQQLKISQLWGFDGGVWIVQAIGPNPIAPYSDSCEVTLLPYSGRIRGLDTDGSAVSEELKPAGSLGMVGVEKASPDLEAMAPRETPGRPAAPAQMSLGDDRVARVETKRKDAA